MRRSAVFLTAAALLTLPAIGGCSGSSTTQTAGTASTMAGGHMPSATTPASGKVVELKMLKNAFDPMTVTIPADVEVTLRFTNTDTEEHEAFVGDQAAQDEHAKEMTDGSMTEGTTMGTTMTSPMGGGSGTTMTTKAADHMAEGAAARPVAFGHDSPGTGMKGDDQHVTVAPGKTGELTVKLAKGSYLIGCHVKDHYKNGMKATLTVA